MLAALVHDPSLISRATLEETLRYKALDGVPAALDTIARAWFPDGRQVLDLRPPLAALAMPVQIIWGRDDRIIPLAHAEALAGRTARGAPPGRAHPDMEKAGDVNPLDRPFRRGEYLMQATPKPTVLSLADDLEAWRTSSRALVEAALAAHRRTGRRRRAHLYQGACPQRPRGGRRPGPAAPRRYVASPLAGLPVSIKDLFDVAGEISLAGSKALDYAPPGSRDCPGRRAAARRWRGLSAAPT